MHQIWVQESIPTNSTISSGMNSTMLKEDMLTSFNSHPAPSSGFSPQDSTSLFPQLLSALEFSFLGLSTQLDILNQVQKVVELEL